MVCIFGHNLTAVSTESWILKVVTGLQILELIAVLGVFYQSEGGNTFHG
jgi:hypothetical protein